MLPGLGASAWASLQRESVWGTNPETGYQYVEIAGGETMKLDQTYFQSPRLSGAAVKEIHQGTKKTTGELHVPVRYEGLELLFKDLLGDCSSAGEASGYRHTFTPADDLPTGLTVELFRDKPDGKAFVHTGCKLSRGVFRIEKDAVLMFAASFLGKSATLEDVSGTPSFPTAEEVLTCELAMVAGTFSGTVDVLSASIEVNNPMGEDRFDLADGCSLKEPQRSGKRTVTGTIEGEFGEEAQYTDWTGDVAGTLTWTWTGPEFASGENYELVIILNCKFTMRQPQVADAGPVRLTGTFQAFEDGVTPDIQVELLNEVVSVP